MRSSVVFLAAAAIACSSCAYEYGSRADGPTFSGVGWDSGIAYGGAREAAERAGHTKLPSRVSAHCALTMIKMVAAGTVVGVVTAASRRLSSGETTAILSLTGLLAIALPNCSASITFAAPPPPPPAVLPSPTAPPAPVPEPAPPAPPVTGAWNDPFR